MPKRNKKKDEIDEAIEKAEMLEAERRQMEEFDQEKDLCYIG